MVTGLRFVVLGGFLPLRLCVSFLFSVNGYRYCKKLGGEVEGNRTRDPKDVESTKRPP